VGLERGPLSTIEELLGRNSSGSGLENQEYDRRDPFRWPRPTLYQQKLALTSPTSGGRPAGTVCLRTKATGFVFFDTQQDAHCEETYIISAIIIQSLPPSLSLWVEKKHIQTHIHFEQN
jgi:hypothetical protein